MKRLAPLFAFAALVIGSNVETQAAEIVSVTQVGGEGSAAVGQRAEFDVVLAKSYAHPFDPAEVTVEATLNRAGGGTVSVQGFWFQDHDAAIDDQGREFLTTKGLPGFRVRFRPFDAGEHEMTVTATDADGSGTMSTGFIVAGSSTGGGLEYVRLGTEAGFVRDGLPWVPFGANVCWSGAGGTKDIEGWYDRMRDAGLDWSRLWMTSFDGTALEWKAGGDDGGYAGVGTYNLKAAWRVDRILQMAEERGISVQLVLQQHSQFECLQWSSWAENPWNVANGGLCATSMEFFTNVDVVEGFDARVRYITARYGDSPAVMAWELWNEVDLIQGYDPDVVVQWAHNRVANLRKFDPYRHLVTTSYAMPVFDEQDWDYAGYDFVQMHNYISDYWSVLPLFGPTLRAFGKPVVLGEFGIDTQGVENLRDKDGTHLVNATMLAVMSGFTGGAMSWWWDNYLTPEGLWATLGTVADRLRALGAGKVVGPIDDVTVTDGGTVDGSSTVPADHVVEARAAWTVDGAMVWLHDAGSEWNRDAAWGPVNHIGVVVEVAGAGQKEGACRGVLTQCDPWSGACAAVAESPTAEDLAGGGFRFTAADFARDLLIKVACLGPIVKDEGGIDDAAADGDLGAPAEDLWPMLDAAEPGDSGTVDEFARDLATDDSGLGEEPEVKRPRSHGCSAAF